MLAGWVVSAKMTRPKRVEAAKIADLKPQKSLGSALPFGSLLEEGLAPSRASGLPLGMMSLFHLSLTNSYFPHLE